MYCYYVPFESGTRCLRKQGCDQKVIPANDQVDLVHRAMFQRDPRAGAFLGGDRVTGQDIRDQNGEHDPRVNRNPTDHRPVTAALSIANIVKSSLGPLGLDKMLVDNIGVSASFRFLCSQYLLPSRK